MFGTGTPATESELMLHVPPSNRRGTFPRDLLPMGERIVYETRPGYFRLYWGRFTVYVLLMALFLAPSGTPGYATNPALYFFLGIFGLLLLISLLQWQRTAYALTNQRVLRVGGLQRTQFADAFYDNVHNLSMEPGFSGGIRFDTGAPAVTFPTGVVPSRVRVLRWRGLADAPRVYSFVQRAFAVHARQTAPPTGSTPYGGASAPSSYLVCPQCGTVADPRVLPARAPACPSCGVLFPRVVPAR